MIRRLRLRTKKYRSVHRTRPFDPVAFTALLKKVYAPAFAKMFKQHGRFRAAFSFRD